MSWLGMLKPVFHFVFEHAPQQIRHIGECISHHRTNCNSSFELDEAAQGVYVSIKSTASLLVTIKDDWLSETERHRRLSIFVIAFAFTSAINKHLRTLHHQALD